MQDSWLSKKAEEIQSFADRKDMKKFHDALKTRPKKFWCHPTTAHGTTLLTDKDATLERWAEHFNSVLNRPSSVNDNAINRLPKIDAFFTIFCSQTMSPCYTSVFSFSKSIFEEN